MPEILSNQERAQFLKVCKQEGVSESEKVAQLIRAVLNRAKLP
jgi:hypothetical protein